MSRRASLCVALPLAAVATVAVWRRAARRAAGRRHGHGHGTPDHWPPVARKPSP